MHDLNNIPKEIVSTISAQTAFEKNVLAIKKNNGTLSVAMPNVKNIKLVNDLSFDTGFKINPVEVPAELILEKLKEYYPDYNTGSNGLPESGNENINGNYSNVEYVNQVISSAIKQKASDIHFEVMENAYRVRYRIDGHLTEVSNIKKSRSAAIISRIKIMSNLDISEKRRPQDGRILFAHENKNIDIRVSCLPASFGEKVVLRILDKSQLNLELKSLGLNDAQYELFRNKIKSPFGMILVTGPTGSGKTTSLYAALKEIHSIEKNILTIEDPIEYNLDGINQCNVKSDIGFNFANALRSFLRQDPDIIMLGEIRDQETAEIAIRSSLTGHLVFSTLHTNDSISGITRLVDMGVEPYLVAASVKLIIAQRLVRKLCDCKVPDDKAKIIGNVEIKKSFKKKGCPKCKFTGYKGRMAIFELFEVTDEIAELITANKPLAVIKEKALKNNFISMRESGIEKIKNGITTYEEVLRETML
ncbi:MAG: GspE/PulE family protein [Ignavibacteria bacterium]|jgi:type IV pilus assembly protein PilB